MRFECNQVSEYLRATTTTAIWASYTATSRTTQQSDVDDESATTKVHTASKSLVKPLTGRIA